MNQRSPLFEKDDLRLILFHKHPLSARMHFLYWKYSERRGGVCAFKPLPTLAAPIDRRSQVDSSDSSVFHPAAIKKWGEQVFDSVSLHIEPEFCEQVEVPHGKITVYLAGFEGYELPLRSVERYGARFISLMECVGIAPVEMLLLQRAYNVIMGIP